MEDQAVKAAADWWARGLGIAAFIVALVSVLWNIYSAGWRDRARLKLDMHWGMKPNSDVADEWIWFIEAANTGRRPLTISSHGGLDFPNGRWLALAGGAEHLPKRLEEGESLTMWITESDLRRSLKEINLLPTHIVWPLGRQRHRQRIPRKYKSQMKQLVAKSEGAEVTYS